MKAAARRGSAIPTKAAARPSRSVRGGWSVSRDTSGGKSTHRFEPTSDAFHDEYDHGSWCMQVPEPAGPASSHRHTGRSRSSAASPALKTSPVVREGRPETSRSS